MHETNTAPEIHPRSPANRIMFLNRWLPLPDAFSGLDRDRALVTCKKECRRGGALTAVEFNSPPPHHPYTSKWPL